MELNKETATDGINRYFKSRGYPLPQIVFTTNLREAEEAFFPKTPELRFNAPKKERNYLWGSFYYFNTYVFDPRFFFHEDWEDMIQNKNSKKYNLPFSETFKFPGNVETTPLLMKIFDSGVCGLFIRQIPEPEQNRVYVVPDPIMRYTPMRDTYHHDRLPAIEWPGEQYYYRNGILIPDWIVTNPEKITTHKIWREDNTEIRRIMMEKFIEINGPQEFIKQSRFKKVDEDNIYGILYRRSDDEFRVLECINGTPEHDGSRKKYVLIVPPEVRTALEAVAWTYGVTPSDYKNIKHRT